MSDLNSPEVQRFEPLPDQRRQWKEPYKNGDLPDSSAATPERWFEPSGSAEGRPDDSGLPAHAVAYGRGIVGVLFATSLVAALLGAGGTYAALRFSGVLNPVRDAPVATNPKVSIESDQSTVIAAIAAVSPSVVQIVTTDADGNTAIG